MTKRTSVAGELLTKTIMDSLLQDLKDEPLYGKVVTKAAAYDMAADVTTAIIVANGASAIVPVTLPPATGTGRIIAMIAKDVTNAVTLIRAGADVINAAGTTITFTPAWEYVIVADITSGQWAILAGTAALT